MPLYEWLCPGCDLTFEGLADLGERNRKRRCPACARLAPRVISQFAIANRNVSGEREIDSLTRPLAPPVPPAARFCWMNDKAADRFAAYHLGRGHEYDDRHARAAELRKQRGEIAKPARRIRKGARSAAHRQEHA
ncbi:MAG: zinc ribbon domain-containing protein [Candidatus Binataceae bacterium]|nr:zinc ribbon domain-containing protein [Candidatus Binataceae bacterium]